MGELDSITDIANIRYRVAASPAEPGMIAIQNVLGNLQGVDDQGVASNLGGGVASVGISATDYTNTLVSSTASGTVALTSRRGYVWVPSMGAGVDIGPAINTALALAAAHGLSGVELGYGVYEIATKVSMATYGQHLKGQGTGFQTEVRLRASAALPVYIESSDLYGVVIHDFMITTTAALTSGDAIKIAGAGATPAPKVNTFVPAGLTSTYVMHVDIIGCFNGVHIADSTSGAFNVHVEDCTIQPCNGGAGVWVDTALGGGIFARDCWINTIVPAAASEAKAGIRVSACGDCTLTNMVTYQCQYGLWVDAPTATTVQDLTVVDCDFDTSSKNCALLSGAGAIQRCVFTGTWFAGANVHGGGAGLDGNNVVVADACTDIRFVNCHSYEPSASGAAYFTTTGATRVFFDACSAGGGLAGFSVSGTPNVVAIRNCDIGFGIFGGTSVGIFLDPVATNIIQGGNTIHATTPTAGAAPTVQSALDMVY